MGKITVSLLVLFIVALSWSACAVDAGKSSKAKEKSKKVSKSVDSTIENEEPESESGQSKPDDDKPKNSPRYPMTFNGFEKLVFFATKFKGKERKGVSRQHLRETFEDTMEERVMDFMTKEMGGSIEEFGERRDFDLGTCGRRPALTMADVAKLAQQSFNVREFEPKVPPCKQSGKTVKCNYDTGKCCQRPQVEFIGRYYDTAIAAMALGATKNEAFAPLIHARALAYTLEACDPDANYKGNFDQNKVAFQSRHGNSLATKNWKSAGLSLISFPQSYEVLYELYNTMLIERLKSRANTHFPSHAQMDTLLAEVYYKKLFARVVPLELELDDALAFPSSSDFSAAGLKMVTSARIQTSRLLALNNSHAMQYGNFYMNPTQRKSEKKEGQFSSLKPVSVYEKKSRSKQQMDLAKCNHQLGGEEFFQFKVSDSVTDKYEACCAAECHFMARYGGTFSAGNENCCAGCNRASCSANDATIAKLLAEKCAIESPSKKNAGPSEVTMAV